MATQGWGEARGQGRPSHHHHHWPQADTTGRSMALGSKWSKPGQTEGTKALQHTPAGHSASCSRFTSAAWVPRVLRLQCAECFPEIKREDLQLRRGEGERMILLNKENNSSPTQRDKFWSLLFAPCCWTGKGRIWDPPHQKAQPSLKLCQAQPIWEAKCFPSQSSPELQNTLAS